MKSVRLSDPNHLTWAHIDEILCKGTREDFEELAVQILREPKVAQRVDELYTRRMPLTASYPEFTGRTAYEAAIWLTRLAKEFPPLQRHVPSC